MNAFKKSLMLARVVGDLVYLRRATRGLGASKRLIGDRQGAIEEFQQVLTISQQLEDTTGDMEALGAIADIYTSSVTWRTRVAIRHVPQPNRRRQLVEVRRAPHPLELAHRHHRHRASSDLIRHTLSSIHPKSLPPSSSRRR